MADPERLPPLTEAQIEVMDVVWAQPGASVRDVWRALRSRRRIARNTVFTTLARLEERGWLRSTRRDDVLAYQATVSQEAARTALVQRLADAAFGGSAADLVVSLLADKGVSRQEAQRVRRAIEDAERRAAK